MVGRNDPYPCGSGKRQSICRAGAGAEGIPSIDAAFHQDRPPEENAETAAGPGCAEILGRALLHACRSSGH